jgi:hypothetical protein
MVCVRCFKKRLYVLDVLRRGYMSPFAPKAHKPVFVLSNNCLPDNDKSFVEADIGSLMKNGAVQEVKERPQVVSLEAEQVIGMPKIFDGYTKYYFSKVIPFGLAPAPYVFTKVFRVLVCFWRSKEYGLISGG